MQKLQWFKTSLLSVALVSITAFTATQSFAKQYYKWVDANGSTHYTTTPPPAKAKKHGKVDTYGASRSSSSAPVQNNTTSQPQNNATQNNTVQAQHIPVAQSQSAPVENRLDAPQ